MKAAYMVFYRKNFIYIYYKVFLIQNYLEHIGKISQSAICGFQTPSAMKGLYGIHGDLWPYPSLEKISSSVPAVNLLPQAVFAYN